MLDLETTGIGPDAEIVQLALIDKHGDVLLDTLVKPEDEVPPEASEIHGIVDADVEDAPAFPEVYAQLAETLGEWPCVVAYNTTFEARVLDGCCRRHALDQLEINWQCAMREYADFWGEWDTRKGNYRWQNLAGACRQQEIEVEGAHSAAGDCRLTLALIQKMADPDPPPGDETDA